MSSLCDGNPSWKPDRSLEEELIEVAELGLEEDVERLLTENNNVVNVCLADGITPLHAAVWGDQMNVVQLLLRYTGVEVNAVDRTGATPLMDAVLANSLDISRVLLVHGSVNFSIQEVFCGRTALHLACEISNPDMIRHQIAKRPPSQLASFQ
jgi:ankyrin repeat protein